MTGDSGGTDGAVDDAEGVLVDVDGASDDLDDVESALDRIDDGEGPLSEFVRALRSAADDDVRSIVRYGADGHRLVFLREDLRERYDEATRRERVEALVMKALGDPTGEAALSDFGDLDATLRWYEGAVVAVYPAGEWSGVVATFDRRDSPLVDVAVEHLA